MQRLGPLLALIGALACNKPEQGRGSLGSPSSAAAGSEASNPDSPSKPTSASSSASGLARSLVAVAATTPSDAQPCERACGHVGDCLLETRTFDEFESGRLELECLDRCVHTAADAASRTAFLACDRGAQCNEVLGCAQSNWDPLAVDRVAPIVQGVTHGGDPCIEGCRWLYSCIYTGAAPGQIALESSVEEAERSCEAGCQSMSETDLAHFGRMAECLPANCSMDAYMNCFNGF